MPSHVASCVAAADALDMLLEDFDRSFDPREGRRFEAARPERVAADVADILVCLIVEEVIELPVVAAAAAGMRYREDLLAYVQGEWAANLEHPL